MGKIADALGKYAQERKSARVPGLTREDLDVLLAYNRETGHLINYDDTTGQIRNTSKEVLRNKGTIQRLLENKLIFPGGKLTSKGIEVCRQRQQPLANETLPGKPDEQPVSTPAGQFDTVDPLDRPKKDDKSTTRSPGSMSQPTEYSKPRETVRPQQKDQTLEIKITPSGQPVPGKFEVTKPADKKIAQDDRQIVQVSEAKTKSQVQNAGVTESIVDKYQVKFDANSIDENLVSFKDPQSYESEQFKILRNSILFPVSGTTPQSILVTGAMPGDGKSFVSANLAISIALNVDRHVLLIDCDIRQPKIHRMFGFDNLAGLSDYLLKRRELSALLVRSCVDKLSLLPGGDVPPNPSELMSSDQMSDLIKEVQHRYSDRLIVLDSPPPAFAAETTFLARNVDGVVLVVKHGKTPREDVEDVMEQMGTDKLIGVVVNQLDLRISSRYGYKKYGKYGKRYQK